MSEELVHKFLDQCRLIISGKVAVDEGTRKLKEMIEKNSIASSILFDVLTALDIECGPNSGGNPSFRKLLLSLIDEVIPSEVINLELNALEAEDKSTKSRIVKFRTRIYYKQVKFNLLHEENEGYAKLISEILSTRMDCEQIMHVIERLIGQFNLDPNRVIDIILDCFEQLISKRTFFLNILKKFKIHRDELRNILFTKFVFCEKAGYTPMDLYRLASILCQADLIDLRSFFAMISPSQEAIREEYANLCALVAKRAAKAESISTGSLADASIANFTNSLASGDMLNGPEPSTSTLSAISFEAANQSQIVEDRKLAGNLFDDAEVLQKNQKLGLLCALLEHGSWNLAKQLLDFLPEGYALGKSRRICSAIANIIGFSVESFYKLKYSHWRESAYRQHESWRKFTHPVEQVSKWDDLTSLVLPMLNFLGPYIALRHEVAVKLIRIASVFFEDEEATTLSNFDSLRNGIMDMFDGALLPASSLLNSNFSYCEELWQVLQRFPPENRYRMYGRWKNVYTTVSPRPRYWDLAVQRGKVLGMTRYAMKRLSKETAKVVGRQLGKLCHTFPLVALDYMLDKVQDFQNFIAPVVDSMRFLSNLGFDVLAYVLIENLSNPLKGQFKTTDGAFSPWLISLSNFAAAVYRRYTIDFSGLLQYISNQLKDGKNLDLIVLREVVSNISGVEASTDLTQEHLEALCGGDYLRQEAGFSSLTKVNRRAISRLRDALLKNNLFESICILISQQKNFIIYKNAEDYPLKLTTHMLDQSQETFVQFFHFLRGNLRPDEYAKRIPPVSQLLTKFYMSIEAAMCLSRPIYLSRINAAYDAAKKNLKEDGKKGEESKTKLNENHKTTLYKNEFENVINALEEELIGSFPDAFWLDVTSRLYATFWLFSVNDLSAPLSAYEREIDKCRKELLDVSHYASDSTSKARRNAKDEERLKTLEQKLSEEMRKQTEHCKRIKEILIDKKEVLFAVTQNRSSQMLRFLQSCILPRAVFTEVDAVYCAKFVEALHVIRTGFFQTIVFFDKIFTDVTPILAGLTERETNCFGRFCGMCLELIQRWHSSPAIFKEECEGYPGCLTKIRKRETDEPALATPFTYESYRTICYKWQIRLARSLSYVLASSNYVLIRNGLTLMTKILPNFPIITQTVKMVEKSVTSLRDNEKGKRLDLNLLAASYLVQLTKRNVRIYETKEFYNPKKSLSTTTTSGAGEKNGAVTNGASATEKSPAASKRKAIISGPKSEATTADHHHVNSAPSAPKKKSIPSDPSTPSSLSSRKRQMDIKALPISDHTDSGHHQSTKRKTREH